MSKVRVHELAKKLNISNKELQEKLTELNVEVKSHMSSINDEIVSKIESLYGKDDKPSTKPQTKQKSVSKEEPKQESKVKPKEQPKQQPKQESKQQPKEQPKQQPKENVTNEVKHEKTNKKGKKDELIEKEDDIKIIEIGATCTVKELADALDQTSTEIITILFKQGIMATINQNIDFEIAREIAESFDVICERAEEVNLLEQAFAEEDEEEDNEAHMKTRPPVVVVMGHVDHGKTSLLDSIKNTDIIGKEAGGITQHIGAYTVKIDGKSITFLDTPGHEAFTAMRMRGAQITDIAILVVAADDGVMPQTIEAINHAKAANLDIIVAINKIDKPGANPDRVKQELTEYGILVEDWGGDVISVPVSAKTGEGIETLLEMINLTAEMKELRANYKKRAKGTVIEGFLDKGRGAVANILVQNGTLRVGDPIVAGAAYGKIRAMIDDKGNKVKKATPSMPVEILGLSEVPKAGDLFYVAKNDKQARQLAESVKAKTREDMIKDTPQKVSLDDLFNQIQAGSVKELKIVIKADVQGSVEAVKTSLEKLSNQEVRIRTIHGGVGAITESDVTLAAASNAIIIGFNVRPDAKAKAMADAEKVDLRSYNVIYKAIEDISTAMHGMLDPIYEEKVIGTAEVRQLFKSSSVGTIAGCYVTSGKITKSAEVRVIREGVVVYTGTLDALKRFKDDAKEVAKGYECGLSFTGFNGVKEGDIVEAFVMEEIERKRLS